MDWDDGSGQDIYLGVTFPSRCVVIRNGGVVRSVIGDSDANCVIVSEGGLVTDLISLDKGDDVLHVFKGVLDSAVVDMGEGVDRVVIEEPAGPIDGDIMLGGGNDHMHMVRATVVDGGTIVGGVGEDCISTESIANGASWVEDATDNVPGDVSFFFFFFLFSVFDSFVII